MEQQVIIRVIGAEKEVIILKNNDLLFQLIDDYNDLLVMLSSFIKNMNLFKTMKICIKGLEIAS